MKNILIYIFITMVFSIIFISCKGGEMSKVETKFEAISEISNDKWEELSNKKIYFGHQSVGFNILNGVKDLIDNNKNIKLNLVKTEDPNEFNKGIFAHSGVSKNGYPLSKIDDFYNTINNGIGKKVDYAFFKFCYVDIRNDTDVEKVFSQYKNSMDRLAKEYPDTTFAYLTVPLTTELSKTTLLFRNIKKVFMRKILRKPYWWPPAGNINRAILNKMIIEEFANKAPVFDLAKVESTHLDGKRQTFKKNGKTYYSMVPDFTVDGAHLNEDASRLVAEQLLLFLINLN